eukprot:747575-Hanusia_phi.AAC.2
MVVSAWAHFAAELWREPRLSAAALAAGVPHLTRPGPAPRLIHSESGSHWLTGEALKASQAVGPGSTKQKSQNLKATRILTKGDPAGVPLEWQR